MNPSSESVVRPEGTLAVTDALDALHALRLRGLPGEALGAAQSVFDAETP